MKRLLNLAITLFLLAMPTAAVQPPSDRGPRAAESEIRSIDAQRFQAMVKSDVATLEKILSDDLVYIHASGARQNKIEFLGAIRSGQLHYRSLTPQYVKTSVYGNTVLLTGDLAVKSINKGKDYDVVVMFLEVYVNQAGRWQMVAWQSTFKTP